ncbi:TPA: hypothetical protein ACGMXS_001287 [Streptococcus agalactiae]
MLGLKKERYKSDKKGKQDLLHDIIFMADSRDAFMIIGVDEEDKYSIKDDRKDKGRSNTQNVVDSLKLKNYNKLVIINLLYRC